MRTNLLVATAFAALITAGTAATAAPLNSGATVAPQAAAAAEFSDADLRAFATAMGEMQTVAAAVEGTPTAEQQATMAASVQNSGLAIERFNTISTAVSADPVLRARIGVVMTPAPAAGSVAAGITDAELGMFAAAMGKVKTVADSVENGTPTADQQAEMAAAVQNSGLDITRFNAIATAVSQEERLRARIALVAAEGHGGH